MMIECLTRSFAVTLVLAWSSLARADEPLAMGAIGDSLTSAFNAVQFGDNRGSSWATGSNPAVNSVAQRLVERTGREVITANEAIVGSVGEDLDRQVTRILAINPDYVTITVGANDICTWPEAYTSNLQDFRGHVHATLTRLADARPNATVILAPIPDLYQMWALGVERTGCQAKWDLFRICRPLLSANRTEDDRQRFVQRWREANQVLADEAAAFPDIVIHNPDLATTPFQAEHVSNKDCFHPTVGGQALFAEVAWQLLSNHQ